jgi:hypothetical protein
VAPNRRVKFLSSTDATPPPQRLSFWQS